MALYHYFGLLQRFFLSMLLIVTYTESLLSHDEECSALYLFKQSIPYSSFKPPGFRKFDSWKIADNESDTDSNCCLWDGVVCDKEESDGHVIGLDLSKSFLRGRINSSSTLFNLVHLQTLNLAMNDFVESQIPSQISRLKQLRSLNLSDSGFSGQIPNEISHFMKLSSLDLSGNSLKLRSPSLEKLVQNLTRLEELDLSGVDISSSVPRSFANISSLRSIKLTNCLLQDEFPMAIFQLPKLEFLSVASNNKLRGSFPEFRNDSLLEHLDLALTGFSGIVPESISNLNRLTFLRLDECYFSGSIPRSLSNMTQLVGLGLALNEFTGIVPSLVSLSELNKLELSGNRFENGRLPDWLGKLTKLNELYLCQMNLYGEIPPFLSNLTKLRIIGLENNSFFGHIPSFFMNMTHLRSIDLGTNQLHGPIPSAFSNFKFLRDLFLYWNNFSGRVDLGMFVGSYELESLLLDGNTISFVANNNYTNGTFPKLKILGLSECNLKEFPPFLRHQHQMSSLFLQRNEIEGLIPVWMWNNSQQTLQVIDLSYNSIIGFDQHPAFLAWVDLKMFIFTNNQLRGRLPIPSHTTIVYDVSNNNVMGEIPPFVCEVQSLQLLDLSSNNMSGTLPPCLGSLSNSLLVLNLKRNNFHGTMMDSFTLGSRLKRIDLSENRFHGQISKSLANCTDLEVLSLGDNSFEDMFPIWLEGLPELQVLILRSNEFHGPIEVSSDAHSTFPKLRIIDLSNNHFTGRLPDKYFQNWIAMKSGYVGKTPFMQLEISLEAFVERFPYSMTIINKGFKTDYNRIFGVFTAIDLSSNNFEGEIPESLYDLCGLESLNLSNNHLTGFVHPSIENVNKLESLDLSRNKLSGKIPQELLQLGFLAILNVSFNQLDGRIPQGKQFNTFENNSYMGNLGLCGKPLTKECQNSKASTPPQTSTKSSESLLPSERADWIVIFSGVGGGLVVGIIFGNFLYAGYSDWFVERFGTRKDKWIRPLRNKKRNQVFSV